MAGKPTISLNVRISPAHSAVVAALLDRPETAWTRKNQLIEAAIEELGRSHGLALEKDASDSEDSVGGDPQAPASAEEPGAPHRK